MGKTLIKVSSWTNIVILLVFVSVLEVSAMWAKMSVEELVKRSNLIVVGELVSIKTLTSRQTDSGKIKIKEVIVGDKNLKEIFIAIPSPERALKSSTDITYKKGQNGIWFLRLKETGSQISIDTLYLADHPQRFQAKKNVTQILQYLHSQPQP